jgi:hypothetical protein
MTRAIIGSEAPLWSARNRRHAASGRHFEAFIAAIGFNSYARHMFGSALYFLVSAVFYETDINCL